MIGQTREWSYMDAEDAIWLDQFERDFEWACLQDDE